jgi:CheY-like chemotaxis protein
VCRATARLKGKLVPRILVADDNSNIQKMVALAFAEHGIDVVAVGNGEAAVRRMPDLNPDVVLADVFMPVRNGYEVCEFIKKDPRFSKTPVILLVGAFDPLDEQEARRVGADGVLKKPFVPPDPLIAMVTAALEKAPKPELKAAPEPVAEIPKIVAPPPPPVVQAFPDPTPEEEAYMFGSGRRSLDDDEKVEAAAPRGNAAGAPAAVQTVETGIETDADAQAETEEDEKFSGTRADWRRRDEVDFASVPSFSSQLVDAPADAPADALASAAQNISAQIAQLAEQRAETSVVTSDAVAAEEASPSAASPVASVATFEVEPVVEADPFAFQQSEIRSVVATSSVETVAEVPAAEITGSAPPNNFESQAVVDVAPLIHASTVETPTVEPEPVQISQVETRAEVVEAAPAKLEEPPARIEAPRAPEPAPILNSVVETVTSPRKWLDFLLPSRTPKPSAVIAEPAASVVEAAPPPEPVVAHPVADSTPFTAPTPASDAIASNEQASAPAIKEAPVVETLVASEATQEIVSHEPVEAWQEPAQPTATSEAAPPAAESSEVRPIEDLREHWSEIASQLAEQAPLVEAAQSAMNADRSASPDVVATAEAQSTPEAESATESVASADSNASVAQAHAPEETAVPQPTAPSMESLAAAISAKAAQAAAPAASPNIDEVVAKILEKLGPQIQELIAKGVVKPLVEEALRNPDEPKK